MVKTVQLERTKQIRNPTLDSLRILSASIVLFFHLWGGSETLLRLKHPYPSPFNDPSVNQGLKDFFNVGFVGVEIFFVISGYLISKSILQRTPADFLIARFVRLSPVYVICVFLSGVVGFGAFIYPQYHSKFLFLESLTFSNYALGAPNIDPPTWTLWYEARFYLLAFFALCLLGIFTKVNRKNLIFVNLIWLVLISIPGVSGGLLGQIFLSDYASFFILGAFLGLIRSKAELILSIPVISYAGIFCVHELIGRINLSMASLKIGMGLFFLALLAIGLQSYWVPKDSFTNGIISRLGRASYPLYLVHQVVGLALVSYLVKHGLSVIFAINMTFIMLLAFALSYVYFLEDGISRRMRGFLSRTWSRISD